MGDVDRGSVGPGDLLEDHGPFLSWLLVPALHWGWEQA